MGGRLVKDGHIKSLEEIYTHSLPIKEHQIVDKFYAKDATKTLKDEVMKIMPVQKQTSAGQRTRFKAFIVVGDSDGHIGLGVKCSKEVATAIRSAIILAKLSLIPIRRGYWGTKLGNPHTVPCKVTGKCGSVRVRGAEQDVRLPDARPVAGDAPGRGPVRGALEVPGGCRREGALNWTYGNALRTAACSCP